MMGIPHKKVKSMVPDIAEFTELGEFLEFPVRTYSAGMAMRLYFAMALFSEPEILLIDEVFGAGDAAFQNRALERLKKQIFESHIFLFASHSGDLIRQFCSKCIVMSHGKIVYIGQTEEALSEYDRISKEA
ncbi:hypothetical protein LPB72_16610 [Hydrogenophaga crassostreae]|nr:hypothetical protein LPB72_16610 [Hydrogenophaga crassostreae]